MRRTSILFVTALLISISGKIYSQIGVTTYSIYALGINTSQNKMISGEFKTFANHQFDDLSMELAIFYNFRARTYHRFSVGVGLNADPFREIDQLNSLTIPAQLEIYPLQDFKRLSLLFELASELYVEDGVNLRSLWGIRYSFRDPVFRE